MWILINVMVIDNLISLLKPTWTTSAMTRCHCWLQCWVVHCIKEKVCRLMKFHRLQHDVNCFIMHWKRVWQIIFRDYDGFTSWPSSTVHFTCLFWRIFSLSHLKTLQLRPIHHSVSVELTWFSCNEDSDWFTLGQRVSNYDTLWLGALELWVPCPTS